MHQETGSRAAPTTGVNLRLGLALGALLTLAACASPVFVTQPEPTKTGEILVRVERDGLTRVALERGKAAQAWDSVAMRNAGDAPIRQIRFWGTGRRSLLTVPGSTMKPEAVYTPFALLPGEQFALSAPAAATAEGSGNQVFGILHWTTPHDPAQFQGSLMKISHSGVKIKPGGAMTLAPGAGEAWMQMELSAPLTYQSVRIAWDADPAPYEPQLWINLDGDVWVRLPVTHRVDWLHPADITSTVAGSRRFWIRLVYEVPRAGSRETLGGTPPEELTLRRVRIDREMQGPGSLKKWRTGRNEFDIALKGEKPDLEIRMGGK